MEARAYLRRARIAPRKVQIVLDLIRNKPVDVAMATLKATPKLLPALDINGVELIPTISSIAVNMTAFLMAFLHIIFCPPVKLF